MNIAERAIREPEVGSPAQYRRRVRLLALLLVIMFITAVIGDGLIWWQAKYLITLAQRSNVETLILAYFLVYFSYLALFSSRGAIGALRIAYYALRCREIPLEAERRKCRLLGPPSEDACQVVATNLILHREDRPHEPFELAIEDEVGSMGQLRIDGARIEHIHAYREGSNSLFSFFVTQVNILCRPRRALDIVEWKGLDDEEAEKYLGQVEFARNLETHLGGPHLWPRLSLRAADCSELERLLSAVCPALRSEALLPHWEYGGEHKLPIIPEPLGFVSLARSEKRVDPLASITAALLTMLLALGVLIFLILRPPWVVGS